MVTSEGRILVVDDDRGLVQVYVYFLENEGYEVLTAFDGLEGLEKARKEKPDLIILDIMMPGMDGYEVCHRLQQRPDTARIAVLMVTAKGLVDDQVTGYDAGALEFLTKPVTAKELLDRVRSLLWFAG